ncbi:TPA: hypothetical protein NI674_006103 [Pseudomonas aeruginosa]|uniref:hypothetical protein n=1 Tax=Pseudomonas aeruginosa group TaxID=136841 RepID=UPI00071B8728|nr:MULTISPECIES: hypothetical protein [Pseudomonas aeruginosa group]KSP92191.1 hypothetical protein APB27_10260 [Pseudomonas aeruginosa]MBN0001448.1 hypothetical protein [Pseudomonas aeruginosa]MBN0090972.1 hypothetical protein [Pseudomonas aeruginosa]MBN0147204.1 hypothetical protein [Pseudomonas aeruginosa]MBN0300854.1 hypothetical protein [Pseudomonas aeruginosa]
MRVWAFDENRADFVDASTERMSADPTGCFIIRRGDDVLVCEHGQERPMPERLTVAGVPFDREQFEDVHTLPLRAEMEQDGQWARAQLQARDRSEVSLPLELPIWVTKTPLSIEDMNEIAAAGWAGKLGDSEGKA